MLKDIYFFNSKELAERIGKGEIGQLIQLKHFIIFSILFYSGFTFPMVIASEGLDINEWLVYFLVFIAEAAINYYGILYTYQINQKGDGQNYLGRLFCLALPISVKLFIYTFLVYCLLSAFLFIVFGSEIAVNKSIFTVSIFIVPCLYSIVFYFLVGKYMRVCSNNS